MAHDEKIDGSETSPIDPTEIKKTLSRRFFTIRTSAGMWAFLAIIADLIDLSKWKVFRIIHACFISWNKFLYSISSFLNSIINIDFFDAQQLNIILALTTIYAPALLLFADAMHHENVKQGGSLFGKIIDYPVMVFLVFSFGYIIVSITLRPETYRGIVDVKYFMNSVLPYIFITIICIYFGWTRFVFYKRAILVSALLIASIEIVYFLPFFGDAASAWADDVLETCADRTDDCATAKASR